MASTSSSSNTVPRLVGDIGGTNGRFALVVDGRVTQRREYRNKEFADLPTLIQRYFVDAGTADDDVESACLAVAAPVTADGEAKFTNAPWQVSAHGLEEALHLKRVALINDFAAQAYGLETLGDGDVDTIARGVGDVSASAARVVLGPGTGLGCAALVPSNDQKASVAVTSEGGHMGFAVSTPGDQTVFDVAHARYGRTSWERVCCGSGLALVHAALWPDDDVPGVAGGDPTEVVKRAQADAASHAGLSVKQYCGMLGSYAGDLALVFRALGGVYLTGGVLEHLGDAFDEAAFMERFVDKGRYREWLASLAVRRIAIDDCALRGCARFLEQTAR